MLHIHPPAGTALGTAQQLFITGAVFDVVVFCKQQQQTVAHHIVVRAPRFERRVFSGVDQLEVAGQSRLVKPVDVARRGEAVVKHLVQRQCLAATSEIAIGNPGLPQEFTAGAVGIVDLGKKPRARDIDIADGRFEGMPFRKNLRIAENDFLHHLAQGKVGGSQRVTCLDGKHDHHDPPASFPCLH